MEDALEIIHLITRIKINAEAANDITLSEHDRNKAREFADKLTMSVLARLWQMLLKGLSEIKAAPSGISALEMLMIRIAYAAEVPTPVELIRQDSGVRIQDSGSKISQAPSAKHEASPVTSHQPPATLNKIESFEQLVALFEQKREALLHMALKENAQLVSFEQGKLLLNMQSPPARDFTVKVAEHLKNWTGDDWQIILSNDAGEPSLQAQEIAHKEKRKEEAAAQPIVASVLDQFPGAKIVGVK